MSNEAAKGTSDSTSRRTSRRERTESFSPTGPVRARIATKSGDVSVRTVDGNELEVTLRASSSKYEHLLELATIRFDATNHVLEIESQPGVFSGSLRGVRDATKSWFDFGGSDLDVFVTLPRDSSLDVKTMSGDALLHGDLNDVDVASASGDVNASDSCRTLVVKTASGDVVTGEVHISVARGLVVDVNGNTVSGDLGSNIDLDASGGNVSDEDVLFIKVNTVSGDIRVDKAT